MKKSTLFTILTFAFLIITFTTKYFIKNSTLCVIANILCVVLAIAFCILSCMKREKKTVFTILTFVFLLAPHILTDFIKNPIAGIVINLLFLVAAAVFFVLSIRKPEK